MVQDNGYAFVEVQEDGTKTMCTDCWFEAKPCHERSFDTRPKPNREAMWVSCQMYHSIMGHTTTNRGVAVQRDLRLESRKSTMDNSSTLGSNKEADNVKILQPCNGLLLYTGSGWPAFDNDIQLGIPDTRGKFKKWIILTGYPTGMDVDIINGCGFGYEYTINSPLLDPGQPLVVGALVELDPGLTL
uniref:Uncharacterized protein n=1 Tax=Tanacetum cinerariifolium TaxID=118510 RepID=A0A6L2LGC7_TANCI|nr:hypothetical protein [Tanacetum cinerariifolium]